MRAFVHREDERSEALARRGAEIVVGELLDFDAVRSALEDVDRAYFVYPIRLGLVQATAQFAQAAIEAGVEAIVNMSQISARRDAASHAAREHWLAEQVFNWSGLNVAHIRPTYFAEWLLYLAPMIRQGVMYAPFTTGRHAPIAGEDQGRVIVGILENPEPHRGQVYPLYGPVELTHHEIAGIVGKVLGRARSATSRCRSSSGPSWSLAPRRAGRRATMRRHSMPRPIASPAGQAASSWSSICVRSPSIIPTACSREPTISSRRSEVARR